MHIACVCVCDMCVYVCVYVCVCVVCVCVCVAGWLCFEISEVLYIRILAAVKNTGDGLASLATWVK